MLKSDGVWRKSSRSGDTGACVEVRRVPGAVEVRDSKNRRGAILAVSGDSWRSFVGTVTSEEFGRG